MNNHKKLVLVVLAIFIVGMTLGIAVAEPISAKKYKNKNSITVKVKDGKKTVKVKCKYKKNYKQYLGGKKKNGKYYSVNICYEKKNGMQMGKKGWWTSGSNGGMDDNAKWGYKHNKNHPVTTIKLH